MNKLICRDTPATAEKYDAERPREFERACTAGKALAHMMGRGWTAEVWANLGWHYKVISPCERVSIYPSNFRGKVVGYCAFINEPGQAGGIYAEHGKTPKTAVANVLRVTRQRIAFLQSLVEGL